MALRINERPFQRRMYWPFDSGVGNWAEVHGTWVFARGSAQCTVLDGAEGWLVNDFRSPDVRVDLTQRMPPSGTVAFGYLVRWEDEDNYWLWRITPGTAGTDFELVNYVGGAPSVVASADVDWVASTEYELIFTAVNREFTAYINGVEALYHYDFDLLFLTKTRHGIWTADLVVKFQ